MNIVIYELSSGNQVGEYPVQATGMNYESTEEEHYKMAYQCLVDDGKAHGKKYDDFRYVATS